MKTIVLSLIALVSTALPSISQVTLNQGETYVFEFASLPYARVEPGVGFISIFQFEVTDFHFERMRWELFEDSAAETPFATGLVLPNSGGGPTGTRSEAGIHWVEDHQGVARFTMEFGSATLSQIRVTSGGPLDAGSHNVFEATFVPVPEPGVVGLLGASVLGLGVWRFRNRRRSTE